MSAKRRRDGGGATKGSTTGGTSTSAPEKKSEAALQFLVDLKFRNNLPPVPFDPKFLRIKTKRDRFYRYKRSTLERSYEYRVHIQPSLGPPIHLIDPSSAAVPETRLEEADRLLLRTDADEGTALAASVLNKASTAPLLGAPAGLGLAVGLGKGGAGNESATMEFLKRAEKARAGKSWLLKTQYLDNNLNRSVHSYSSGADEARRRAELYAKQREEWEAASKQMTKLERIEHSFAVANDGTLPKHQTKPHLKPVKVFQLLPEVSLAGNEYYQVQFADKDIAPAVEEKDAEARKKTQEMLLAHAKLAQVGDAGSGEKEDTNVALLVPMKSTKDVLDEELEGPKYDFDKLSSLRDYTFAIRTFLPEERFAFVWDSSPAKTVQGQTKCGTVNFVQVQENAIDLKRNPSLYSDSRKRKIARLQQFHINKRQFTEEEKEEREKKVEVMEEGESDSEDENEEEDPLGKENMAKQGSDAKEQEEEKGEKEVEEDRAEERKKTSTASKEKKAEDSEVSSDSSSSSSSDSD